MTATTLHPSTPAQLSTILTTPDITTIRVRVGGVLHEVHSLKTSNGTLLLDVVPVGTLRDLLAAGWLPGSYPMSGEPTTLLWTHPQAPTAAAPTWWARQNIATPAQCDPRAFPQPGWYPGQWQLLERVHQIPELETHTDDLSLSTYRIQYAGYMRGVGIVPEEVCAVYRRSTEDGHNLVLVSTVCAGDPSTATATVIHNDGYPWGPPLD